MIPGTYNLNVYQGSTFGPIVLIAYSDAEHTTPTDLTGFTAHAKVRETSLKPVVKDLLPTITDGPAGEVTIPAIPDEVTKTLPRGSYVWDLLLERSTGQVLGPFLAGSFTIHTAVSRA